MTYRKSQLTMHHLQQPMRWSSRPTWPGVHCTFQHSAQLCVHLLYSRYSRNGCTNILLKIFFKQLIAWLITEFFNDAVTNRLICHQSPSYLIYCATFLDARPMGYKRWPLTTRTNLDQWSTAHNATNHLSSLLQTSTGHSCGKLCDVFLRFCSWRYLRCLSVCDIHTPTNIQTVKTTHFVTVGHCYTACVRGLCWQRRCIHTVQDAQLSQRDRAAGCVIVFAKSRRLELEDNILWTL